MTPQPTVERLLRREQVMELTGIRKSTLYTMVNAGTFPKQVRTGNRTVAWRLSDVMTWIENCPTT